MGNHGATCRRQSAGSRSRFSTLTYSCALRTAAMHVTAILVQDHSRLCCSQRYDANSSAVRTRQHILTFTRTQRTNSCGCLVARLMPLQLNIQPCLRSPLVLVMEHSRMHFLCCADCLRLAQTYYNLQLSSLRNIEQASAKFART